MEHDRALVTGGAGFIGSNIVEELVSKDVKVTVLDDLYLGSRSNLSEVENDITFVEGSVLDNSKVSEAMKDVDVVFHQAARSSAPMHKEKPVESSRVNVDGFVNVCEEAVAHGASKVVYASTSSMYGSKEPPHREGMGAVPTNRYSASKMSREMYAKNYSYNNQLETTGLRYFAVYGPHERAKGRFANVVTQFLWKMMKDERPVIWGDGTQTRDFTYVKDVARANLQASRTGDSLDGEVVNVGTGREVSFNTVVETLKEELGSQIDPKYVDNPRDKYVQRTKADTSKAERVLDWTAQTDFKSGVNKIIEYYRGLDEEVVKE